MIREKFPLLGLGNLLSKISWTSKVETISIISLYHNNLFSSLNVPQFFRPTHMLYWQLLCTEQIHGCTHFVESECFEFAFPNLECIYNHQREEQGGRRYVGKYKGRRDRRKEDGGRKDIGRGSRGR